MYFINQNKKTRHQILVRVNASKFFFLSPRGTSGERSEERGLAFKQNAPPLPGPLLHPIEEREL
jgi:hypothetical protein